MFPQQGFGFDNCADRPRYIAVRIKDGMDQDHRPETLHCQKAGAQDRRFGAEEPHDMVLSFDHRTLRAPVFRGFDGDNSAVAVTNDSIRDVRTVRQDILTKFLWLSYW